MNPEDLDPFATFEDPYNCIEFVYGTPSFDDDGKPYFDEADMNQLAGYIDKLKNERDDLLAACEGLLDTIDGLKEEWDVVMDLKRVNQAHAAIAAARYATER